MHTKHNFHYALLEHDQIEWARKLHNESSTLYQLTDVEHVSESQQQAWFESISSSKTSKRYVVSLNNGYGHIEPIGIFRVDCLDFKNRSVMVGLDLHPSYRGKKLAAPIYMHFLEYYFDQLGMHRIYLKVLSTNERAKHVYEKLGFIVEGRERDAIFRNGMWNDYICMSILRSEYDARKTPDRAGTIEQRREVPTISDLEYTTDY